MRTPREILLARHQSAQPKLDVIRQEIVANALSSQQHEGRPLTPSLSPDGGEGETRQRHVLQLLWNELILPSRRIWAGLAAVWVLIFAANFSMRDHSSMRMAKSPSPEMISTFQQQEQLLTELIGPDESTVAEPQKSYKPRPASQRTLEILIT